MPNKLIKKIISGGQTGVDIAALDTAIKLNIPYGGWIPKKRKTESGHLPLKYKMSVMDTIDYKERTKQNIIDSDATAIIYRSKLAGGSLFTRNFARLMHKPYCLIDLLTIEAFEASIILQSFVTDNKIRILNIAGPRASHQPLIYQETKIIIETMIYLLFLDSNEDKIIKAYVPENIKQSFPSNIDKAVELICDDLSLKTKTYIARIKQDKLYKVYFVMLEYFKKRLGFDTQNTKLLKNCQLKDEVCTIEDAVMLILKKLKSVLEQNYTLRLISK